MNIKISLFYFILSFIAHAGFGQKPELKFKHITNSDGLSDGFVRKTIVDHQGFVWFATADGLNKYDGYTTTVFKNNIDDSTSLRSSNVLFILEDSRKNFWAATNDGVHLFNREKNTFIHYPETKKEVIKYIFEDHNKEIWLAGVGCLFRLDTDSNKFKKQTLQKLTSLIEFIYEDRNKNLWVGSREGAAYFDKSRSVFTIKEEINIGDVYTMLEDSQNRFWFGSRFDGIVIFDPATKAIEKLKNELDNPNSLPSNKILSLMEDSIGHIWIGTEHGGLAIYVPKSKKLYTYQTEETDNQSILHTSVYNIYRDPKNIIWLSCFGGVEKLVQKKFKLIRGNKLNNNSLSCNNVPAFFEDNQGLIWIATSGGGLNSWDRNTGNYTHYRHNPKDPTSISSDYVLAIKEDTNGLFWLATWGGGLNSFNPKTKKFTRYVNVKNDSNSILSNNLYRLYIDKDNGIWVSTSFGLDFFDTKTNKFLHYNIPKSGLSDLIGGLYEDKEGNFWVGSFNGLYILDKKTKKLIPFPYVRGDSTSVSCNQINSIKEDKKGNLWVCTMNGLNLYNKEKKTFSVLTTKDQLPSNSIFGFLEDVKGNFWMSTGKGICMFNPETKKIRNYNISDGLQGETFIKHSIYQLKSGEMLFGGFSGFNIIDPENVLENKNPPPVVLTDLKIFNESMKIDGVGSPLVKDISLLKELFLNYNQSVISFDFAALDYSASEKNEYAYRMEGFEEKWNFVGAKRTATYTNLDPGSYTFRVKASNNDGIWNETGTAINIFIAPPYWKTWWFRCSVLVLLGVLLWLLHIHRIRLISIQKAVLEEKVRIRTSEIIEQGKHIEELYVELKDSIRAAQAIQNSILPPQNLIQKYLPESFILNKPKDVVGGDLYYFNRCGNKLLLAAIDCTGHGVSGAFMSIIAYNLLNKIIEANDNLSASEILNELNIGVINELNKYDENQDKSDGMDISLCIISQDGKTLQFSGANHPLYLIRNKQVIQVKANKFSIGKGMEYQVKKFVTHQIALQKEDVFYMFSDGYADQLGGKNGEHKYMYPQFREFLLSISRMNMNQQMVALDTNLKEWRGETPQLDDVLVIGFRIPK